MTRFGANEWFNYPDLYEEAVRRMPESGGSMVEVGCWKGASFCHLLQLVKKSGKEVSVYGVDHFQGSSDYPAMLEDAARQDVRAVCLARAGAMGYPFHMVVKNSTEAVADFADGSLDFVFIDAAHSYEFVVRDIAAWRPKVKAGGILAGHDYNQTGVMEAVWHCLGKENVLPKSKNCWWFEVPS